MFQMEATSEPDMEIQNSLVPQPLEVVAMWSSRKDIFQVKILDLLLFVIVTYQRASRKTNDKT